uniref:RING-type E3 ubiquitin transferase n=1 Tax=Noccaea caerulescens TaxID=107243 RepID=A0A1J3J6C2_NOCCA
MDSAEAPTLSSFTSTTSSASSSDTDGAVNRGSGRRFNRRYGRGSTLTHVSLRENASMADHDLTYSCVGVVLAFWFLVAMFMVAGVYGPTNVWIGPNSSMLVQPNPIFVQSVKVKELDDSKSGLQLFGFYESPPLDVFVNWSESRLVSVPRRSYKGWPFYLNKGSSLNISYSIKPENRSVRLVVEAAHGGVSKWLLSEPGYEDETFSRSLVKGSGMMEVKINKSSDYYVAVANSNRTDVTVKVDINVSAVLYDTKDSFFKCAFSDSECTFNAMSFAGNSIVLTSPPQRQGTSIGEEEEWYVRFTYQPRWTAYAVVTGLVACFMLVAIQLWKKFVWQKLVLPYIEEEFDDSWSSQRARLLANKDDDGSSCSGSLAGDDADLDDFVGKDGEEGSDSTTKRLCAICFDAARDCFYQPCGHCVSCYGCGTKVVEANGTCPICRRWIKKVKRIFTV